jgi:hypothetical protein
MIGEFFGEISESINYGKKKSRRRQFVFTRIDFFFFHSFFHAQTSFSKKKKEAFLFFIEALIVW